MQGHWRFPSGREMQGYAYILTHSGTPTVFYDHIISHYQQEIAALMSLRNRNMIHCRSTVCLSPLFLYINIDKLCISYSCVDCRIHIYIHTHACYRENWGERERDFLLRGVYLLIRGTEKTDEEERSIFGCSLYFYREKGPYYSWWAFLYF